MAVAVAGCSVGGIGFWYGAQLLLAASEGRTVFSGVLAVVPGIVMAALGSIVTLVSVRAATTLNRRLFKERSLESAPDGKKHRVSAERVMLIASVLAILSIALYILIAEIL